MEKRLKELGLRLSEDDVREAIRQLRAGAPIKALSRTGGNGEPALMARNTARKLKRLYEEGALDAFLNLEETSVSSGSGQRWPGWSAEELAHMMGWTPEVAGGNIAMVEMAEEQGNTYIPWHFRRSAELAKRYREESGLELRRNPWLQAVAGLPVLAVWMECPPCDILTGLIEEHRPWQGKKQRRAYERSAKDPAAEVKAQALRVGIQAVMNANLKVAPLTTAAALPIQLRALMERVPMFDRRRFLSPFRQFSVGDLFLAIFTYRR